MRNRRGACRQSRPATRAAALCAVFTVAGLIIAFSLFASPAFGGPAYVHLFETVTPGTAAAWTDLNLSGAPYNVPANAIVEVAFVNAQNNADRTGGVRAKGSALNRYLAINRSGTTGNMNVLIMNVQADSSSIIQYYVSSVTNTSFRILGYWTSGTYVEQAAAVAD